MLHFGGSSSSGLRRDAEGREVVVDNLPPAERAGAENSEPVTRTADAVDAQPAERAGVNSSNVTGLGGAPSRRTRHRHKSMEVIAHKVILGPEPELDHEQPSSCS